MGKPRSKVSASEVVARKKKRAKHGDPSSNPFEVRVNRRKHDVLGQKIRSGRGLPGVARSRAVQKRKQTLLQEYRSRRKTGVFLDRRFGEYDSQLSVEEKAAQRFFLEKKKRRGKFNLEDDDNEEGLTHFGQSLGDMEKFDDIQLSDGGEEEEDISKTHFGGFLKRKKRGVTEEEEEEGEENETPKSRKEIMKELVAKSKQMKYERQSERHETVELMETLDTQWEDVRGLIYQPRVAPTQSGLSSAAVADSSTRTASHGGSDYDRVVRELVFERKAMATDRLKTSEELAREERGRLMKLETDRLRRMRGEERVRERLDEEEADHTSADAIITKLRKKKDVRFMLRYEDGVMVEPDTQTGDSEGEEEVEEVEEEVEVEEVEEEVEVEEVEEEEEGGGEEESELEEEEEDEDEVVGENEVMEEEGEEEEEENGDPTEEFGSDLESEKEDEEEDSEDREIEEEREAEGAGGSGSSAEQQNQSDTRKEAMQELPYTFKMPTSLPDLLAVTTGRSPEECGTVVERIHSCYHPSLASENRQLLEKFMDLLVSYCCHLGKKATQGDLQTINRLAGPLLSLAQVSPLHTARLFRRLLSSVHKSWKSGKRRQFPSFNTVVLFWLVGVVFPTSDFRHPVTTPAMLIVGQILLKSSVRTHRDLLLGLSLCHIFTSLFISSSKRFVPELVNFLTSCTGLISTHPTPVFFPPFPAQGRLRTAVCESLNKWPSASPPPPPHLSSVLCWLTGEERVREDERESGGDPTLPVAAIASCLQSILTLSQLYKDLPSFMEIFSGISFNLRHVSPNIPHSLKELVGQVLEKVSHSAPRPVLQLLRKKPKSIKFYEPSFDAVYDVRKRRTPGKSANERQKLKHKVKMERKGAIRELKKDAHFLSREKIKDSREKDAEREKKTRQIVQDLQNMQHEAKMERLSHHRRKR